MDIESPEFYMKRYEVLLEQIRDGISENVEILERIADSLSRLQGESVTPDGRIMVQTKSEM